ncbi:MAG: tyrosine-type recombinase/integrase [Acidimicrobiia bacterium]
MAQHGQVLRLNRRGADRNPVWAYRYRADGRDSRRPQVGGFASRAEAQRALRAALGRLRPGGRAASLTLGELVEEYLEVHQAEPTTIAKLRWLLAKATCVLGEVRVVDLRPEQVCAWRASLPEGSRFAATHALRQVLNRAVAWELITSTRRSVASPTRRRDIRRSVRSSHGQRSTPSPRSSVLYGPMVVFAAATGLRPAELFALEQRDVDFAAGVVYVRRAFAYGRLKKTKTRRSMRAVPLQTIALEVVDQLPRSANALLFPAPRGGYVDLRNFRRRQWRPAQLAAGIEPLRRPYDLRHTYATFALRAGVSIFDLSRFMGASLAMIDLHYGHLARDGREHAVALLDALAAGETGWTLSGRRNRNPESGSGTRFQSLEPSLSR